MEFDFTINTYHQLLRVLKNQGYSFLTFSEFLTKTEDRACVLRHDVDKLPYNSLVFAQLQYFEGIKGTYYFRVTPTSFNEEVISLIHGQGHEIGYHYEDLSICKGNIDEAIKSFGTNLQCFRKITNVETICMHGSPLSKWDSRLLWDYHDYRNFGITGEPYFDIDFNNVLYLTDTGRRWDGDSYNIRDKITKSASLNPTLRFHSTFDIINAAKKGVLPEQLMITFHPQRWVDKPVPWFKEYVNQNIKNLIKLALRNLRNK